MMRLKYIIKKCAEEPHAYANSKHTHRENEPHYLQKEDFKQYVAKHGYHFSNKLAEYASTLMENNNGQKHSWSTSEMNTQLNSMGIILPKEITLGDMTYLANMYYADFYNDVITDEITCIKAARRIANDIDGYKEIAFCRWLADIMAMKIEINWLHFI